MNQNNEIIIYQTPDGEMKIDVRMENETVWLSLDQMAELFQRDKSTISRHIKNVFDEGELDRNSVVANYATTALDGKTYQVDYYNLDVIISVGYRVKSQRGTQFRIWATQRIHEYLQKGFTINADLLKKAGGGGYWQELLETIRDIRSSEKVFYRQVWTFTPPVLTMTRKRKHRNYFSKLSKIKCTMQRMDTPLRKSSCYEQMRKILLWE